MSDVSEVSPEKKLALKCIPRGPVPRFNRKLDYNMLPQNLRQSDVVLKGRITRDRRPQTLPPGQIDPTLTEKYQPLCGTLYERVARHQYVSGLVLSSRMSHEGPTFYHQSKEDRARNLMEDARGSINLLRGAGREISQDPMKNLMVDGSINKKIRSWKSNSNATEYRIHPGLEFSEDKELDFTGREGFPLRKVLVILVCLCGVYYLTKNSMNKI